MKRQLCYLLAALALGACSQPKQMLTISVSNDLPINRQGELVELSMEQVSKQLQLKETDDLVLTDADGNELPYQLTYDEKLLFAADVQASSAAYYTLRPGTPTVQQSVIACGRQYPERLDDMAWENDKVGFRAYGPALQACGERGFGYDLFPKRGTSEPVLETLYAEELDSLHWVKYRELAAQDKAKAVEYLKTFSYHVDHGYGMDCYAVGSTLGGGVAALLEGEEIVYPWCYDTYEILDNGPLRFTVRLTFKPMTVGSDTAVVERRLITLDAGSHLNRTVVTYEGLSEQHPIVAGFALHNAEPVVVADQQAGYITYVDPTTGPDQGEIYVGAAFPVRLQKAGTVLFTPEERKQHSNAYGHLLGEGIYEPDGQFLYYWGFGWSHSDMPDAAAWNAYMKEFTQKMNHPLQVNVK